MEEDTQHQPLASTSTPNYIISAVRGPWQSQHQPESQSEAQKTQQHGNG